MIQNEIFLLKYREGHLFASGKETAFLCILSPSNKSVNQGLIVSQNNTIYLNPEKPHLALRSHFQNWLLSQKQTNKHVSPPINQKILSRGSIEPSQYNFNPFWFICKYQSVLLLFPIQYKATAEPGLHIS